MTVREKSASASRALEALLYIASRLEAPSIHEVLKIRYFADKEHLSRYGFMASGDRYYAMRYGPVASLMYEVFQAARGDAVDPGLRDLTANALDANGERVSPLRPANSEFLAPSDLECLDEAIATYGGLSFDERVRLSHDSAYHEAWEGRESGVKRQVMPPTLIAKALSNSEEVIGHMQAP